MTRPTTAPSAQPQVTFRASFRAAAVRAVAGVVAGATLLVTAPAGAQTTTLTFENVPGSAPAGGVRRVNNCVVESGVRVTVVQQVGAGFGALPCETGTPTASTPTALAMYTPDNGSYAGSNALFNDVGSGFEFTTVAGSPFSLLSLDLASYDMSLMGPLPVTFMGTQVGGTSVMQMFSLDMGMRTFSTFSLTNFTNLTSARVTFGAPLFGAQIDNVRVGLASSVVPEPSTYALMATGLVGLGALARRRRAATRA
jgi:hypothetical protein